MELTIDENGEFLLKKVYTGVGFETSDGEYLGVCMRDSGFEINYFTKDSKSNRNWYEFKNGVINKLGGNSNDLKWISVKEKMPEKPGQYLVTNGRVVSMCGLLANNTFYGIADPTYWMCIPNIPSENIDTNIANKTSNK